VARKPLGIALSFIVSFSNFAIAETPVERGEYLVKTILACGNCHTPKTPDGRQISEKELSGGLSFTTSAFNAVAANITPDRETGIGTWSDNDIKTALTKGMRPAHARLPSVPLAAVMPVSFYKAIRPDDLDAIVAYLRSVKPVRNEVAGPDYKMPVQHQSYPDAETGYSADALKDPVKRGAYLATIGHCMECHSAWKRGVSDYKAGFGKGGRQFGPSLVQGVQAGWKGSIARNITTHRSKGIGAWTDAEIKRAITQGVSRDGRKLGPPMAFEWYANLKDNDLNAIVAWLRTVPPQD
jgi:mono/diheme cytochrome c family protein